MHHLSVEFSKQSTGVCTIFQFKFQNLNFFFLLKNHSSIEYEQIYLDIYHFKYIFIEFYLFIFKIKIS